MKEHIVSQLRESAELKLRFAKESVKEIVKATEIVQKCLRSGGKILLFGNGGSAADAQHIASEFVNRFLINRKAFSAIALTTDTSILTSIGNDNSFINIFSRQIEALGKRGDVAWAISTSGRSKNVLKGIETAKYLGLKTIVSMGGNIKTVKGKIDCMIHVPSESTPRIQELQITVAHIICELVEENLSKTK
ncbi:D-sedoheptulose 7-phosphate isomerase [Desulfobacterota bacterium AH_259_B03_O07]|nr:D-sedoheptulose 7-phosphate isomerase [Desulfobacterota bacterium AH_259_B03_O07]